MMGGAASPLPFGAKKASDAVDYRQWIDAAPRAFRQPSAEFS